VKSRDGTRDRILAAPSYVCAWLWRLLCFLVTFLHLLTGLNFSATFLHRLIAYGLGKVLLPRTKEEVNVLPVFVHVCLSVCLLARLLKNACMHGFG